MLLLFAGIAPRVDAQDPLFLVNEDTAVRGIDFKFVDGQEFEEDLLKQQIATAEPGFADKVKRILPFFSADTYPFDPIVLAKDVVRLRRFYVQNGFLTPEIDYPASQLDTTSNTIRVIFTIRHGPPLIIQDVGFFSPDGNYLANSFEGRLRESWIEFRDKTSFRLGDRYTEFDKLRIQDQALTWLQDRGFAFVQINSEATIDSTANTADIRFEVDPGPRGFFAEIAIEGNTSISDKVVRRELPFKTGDQFSNKKLIQGQRELFGLNLFRVALADVPPSYSAAGPEVDSLEALARSQPDAAARQRRDETVNVRFRVREAKLRYVTAQTGYALDNGITLQGEWTHRNFLGGARTFTAGLHADTGILARASTITDNPRLYRASVALRQPYLFTTQLSGIVEPFIQYQRDPLLQAFTDVGFAGIQYNRREYGIETTLTYELLPFRNLNLSYRFSRVFQLGDVPDIAFDFSAEDDPFSESVVRLNATLGDVDDFINPKRGFLVRPVLEQGGGLLSSDVEYVKAGTEVVGYTPFTPTISVGGRLFVGRLWPYGESRNQFDPQTENRFNQIRYYSGGATSVRGWGSSLVGPQFNRTRFARDDSTGAILFNDEGLPRTVNEEYEAVGGAARLEGNIEVRLPFPGLGPLWRTAVFLDVGQVSATSTLIPQVLDFSLDDNGTCRPRLASTRCFEDNGNISLNPGDFFYSVGTGFRYETPVGFLRFDLAYKLNPSDLDLQKPRDAFLFENGFLDEPNEKFLRRFHIHLTLGQAF